MIYCNVVGGLGNMMFQIATAKSISLDKKTDCSFPNLDNHLNYLSTEDEYNPNMKHSHEYNIILGNLNRSVPTNQIPRIQFPFHYEMPIIEHNSFIISGYFQSEKYFKHNRNQILELFSPPQNIIEHINKKYNDILKLKTTSIHIRRGDYLKFQHIHPPQSLNYYKESIEILKDKTDIFLIFSDDIEWCKKNFTEDYFYFVGDEKDYIELFLMSKCNNNITCNSSFSWWGAWLNRYDDNIVIGPKKWFGSGINHHTGDILPDKWIKL